MMKFKEKNYGFHVKKPNSKRLNYSNISFQFNTNLRPTTKEQAHQVANDLIMAAKLTFTSENFADPLLGWIIFILEQDKTKKENPRRDPGGTLADVRKVKVRYEAELGSDTKKGQRMHIHGLISITHLKFIRLDIRKIGDAFNDNLINKVGSRNPIKYWYWHPEKVSLKQYMHKWDEKDDRDFSVDDGEPHGLGEQEFTNEEFADSANSLANRVAQLDLNQVLPTKGPHQFTAEEFDKSSHSHLATLVTQPQPRDFGLDDFAAKP